MLTKALCERAILPHASRFPPPSRPVWIDRSTKRYLIFRYLQRHRLFCPIYLMGMKSIRTALSRAFSNRGAAWAYPWSIRRPERWRFTRWIPPIRSLLVSRAFSNPIQMSAACFLWTILWLGMFGPRPGFRRPGSPNRIWRRLLRSLSVALSGRQDRSGQNHAD